MISNKALQIIRDAFDRQAVWGVTELSHFLQKDRSLIHRYIKELVVLGEVKSLGKGPHTRYTMKNNTGKSTYNSRPPVYFSFSHEEVQLLDKYFFKFAANGEPYEGYKGFILWCRERNISPDKAIINFCKLANYIESQRNKCGLLDVSNDFRQHIEGSAIDKLFFADQYNWMEFGRGKLAELTFYAKDNQSIKLITQSINAIIHQLECLIRTSQVDAIAFTPHSRKRSVQLLKELQKKLNTQGLPPIQLVKYAPYGTIIAQNHQ